MSWEGIALYMLGFFVILYLFIILPKQRQEKKHKQLIESLKAHDKVVTIGGICAEVKKVKEKTFVLKLSEGVEMELLKTAVAYKQE